MKTPKSLDDIDKKMITILQDNSRKSFTQLSKDLDLSETAVRNRVKRLVDTGVIRKFTISLDFDRVGRPITSIIGIKIGGVMGPVAASGLMDINSITEIYTTTGQFDLILKVVCESIEDLENTVEKIRGLGFTKETFTYVILRQIKNQPITV